MEDFKSACFISSDIHMGYNTSHHPYRSMGTVPMHQNDFQDTCIKADIPSQTVSDLRSVQSTQPKGFTRQQKSSVTPASHRRKRIVYNQADLNKLEQFFKTNMYPDIHHREELAKQMCLPESRIQVWFQNRRAKARRQGGKSTNHAAVRDHYPSTPANTHMFSIAPALHCSEIASQQQNMVFPQQQVRPHPSLQQDMFHQPPSVPGVNNHMMYSLSPTLQHPVSLTQQHQIVFPQQPAPEFHQNPEPLSYPESSCAVSRQKLLMNQTASNICHQYVTSNNTSKNQHHGYKYMTPVKEQVIDISSRRHTQMSKYSNFMMDFYGFPPKTIKPEMNINIPQIQLCSPWGNQNDNHVFTTQGEIHMSTMQGVPYGHISPISDSGVSDTCPESGSDWEENVVSVLNSLI
ncbi:homeobox protein Mix.1-like [Rhinophrynus dorsalis]